MDRNDAEVQYRENRNLKKGGFRFYVRTCIQSIYHSVFHLGNDFFNSHQPLIVIIKLQLDSNESSDVKKRTKRRKCCAWGNR